MSKVFIKHTPSYDKKEVYASIKYVMENMGVQEAVQGGKRVLLKPNMLSRSNPIKAITTHPEILNATIAVLKEYGVKAEDMLIADSSGGPTSALILKANYNGCGYTEISKNTGVPLYINQEISKVKTDGVIVKEFEIISAVLEYDVIINLAKFKTHAMTGMSGAVKNIFGTVSGLKKAEFHMRFPDKANFANMIVDLCERVKPNFHIVDDVLGMQGDGPSGGIPIKLEVILAGQNPYLIDSAICHMMGFETMNVPIMKAAIDRDLCPKELPEDTVVGDLEKYKKIKGFILPKSYGIDFSAQLPRAISWATPTIEKLLAPKPQINKAQCIGCEKCKDICPQRVITMVNKKAKINLKGCIKCFCCHEMCPVKAIDIKRFF